MEKLFTFLGSGASLGVPVIGCSCSVCKSSSPFNKRLRSSCLIEWAGKRYVIDPGPDFRAQMLLHKIGNLQGVLITHTHYDHIAGFDDLRVLPLLHEKTLPCLCLMDSYEDLKKRYPYLLQFPSKYFAFETLDEDFGSAEFQGLPLRYVSYHQQGMKVCGFILGSLAYLTDIRDYPEDIFQKLAGVETLILSALRSNKDQKSLSKAHFSIEEAIAFSDRLGAKHTILTHLAHDIDYEPVLESLPQGFTLAYDGLTIPITP